MIISDYDDFGIFTDHPKPKPFRLRRELGKLLAPKDEYLESMTHLARQKDWNETKHINVPIIEITIGLMFFIALMLNEGKL